MGSGREKVVNEERGMTLLSSSPPPHTHKAKGAEVPQRLALRGQLQ